MKLLYTLLLALLLAFGTHAQTTNQIILSFSHRAGDDSLVLNETKFTIWNGKKVTLSRADFYVSEIEMFHWTTPIHHTPLTDQYLLVSAKSPDTKFDVGTWPVDALHGIYLRFGVPKAVNHGDPSVWPNDHPLAPKNPSMHWGWSAGYVFMAINGKVDNDNDGIPEAYFEYHSLGDTLYQRTQVNGGNLAQNGVLRLNFVLDYVQLFKNLDLDPYLYVHGSGALNRTMLTNAATQKFITLPTLTAIGDLSENSRHVQTAPNPANTETLISWELPAAGPLQLILTNTLGQTVHTRAGLSASGAIRLETATLPAGLYQCGFSENGKVVARKTLVVAHK
ncbi:MAG: MbnP family protein [Saprospiraceae bacterium]